MPPQGDELSEAEVWGWEWTEVPEAFWVHTFASSSGMFSSEERVAVVRRPSGTLYMRLEINALATILAFRNGEISRIFERGLKDDARRAIARHELALKGGV